MALDKGQTGMIFIVGNSRSGTTMLGRILGRSREINTFGELHFFEHQVDGKALRTRPAWEPARAEALLERLLTSSREGFFAPVVAGHYKAQVAEIMALASGADPVSLYQAFLHFETRTNGKSIPCEQTPRYLFFVHDILDIFPEARIINVIRDPRDVLISQKNKWKRRFLGASGIPLKETLRAWANYHPILIAKLWVSCSRQAHRFKGNPRVLSLRFEDLLAAPEDKLRAVCTFLGVPFEPEILNVPQIGSSCGVDAPDNVGINSARANSWQAGTLSKTELKCCDWVAHKEMQINGYSPSGNGRFSLLLLPSLTYLVIKMMFALPMNLSRTKNIRDTLRRRLFVPGKS